MDEPSAELRRLWSLSDPKIRFTRKVARAVDRALLWPLTSPRRVPPVYECHRVARELEASAERCAAGSQTLASFHRPPSARDAFMLVPRVHQGVPYEALSFESRYEPPGSDASRARYLAYPENARAHAWVLRHRDRVERPWLFCLHGLGTGWPLMDFAAFHVAKLHFTLGLNVVLPVLPLHGPRRHPSVSRAALVSHELLDTFYGISQAIHDTRALIAWARTHGARRIGVYGMSIGAYVGSLVAGLEDVELLVAGIPACDIPDLITHHVELDEERKAALLSPAMRALFELISPLAVSPRAPVSRRAIYAGSDDLVTTTRQAERLWRHWEKPHVHWFPGAHVSFFWAPSVLPFVMSHLRACAFVAQRESAREPEGARKAVRDGALALEAE